jgi:hypothetical protein
VQRGSPSGWRGRDDRNQQRKRAKKQKKVIRACARGAHAPGCWPRVRARGTAVDDETSSWWSTVSCEPDDGGTPENRCVMAEKLETQWRRVLFTRGDMVAEAVSLDRKK